MTRAVRRTRPVGAMALQPALRASPYLRWASARGEADCERNRCSRKSFARPKGIAAAAICPPRRPTHGHRHSRWRHRRPRRGAPTPTARMEPRGLRARRDARAPRPRFHPARRRARVPHGVRGPRRRGGEGTRPRALRAAHRRRQDAARRAVSRRHGLSSRALRRSARGVGARGAPAPRKAGRAHRPRRDDAARAAGRFRRRNVGVRRPLHRRRRTILRGAFGAPSRRGVCPDPRARARLAGPRCGARAQLGIAVPEASKGPPRPTARPSPALSSGAGPSPSQRCSVARTSPAAMSGTPRTSTRCLPCTAPTWR